ncbi:hypothetical protein F511_37374 [Dorcoceras hygrometricum]|uniref:Uncharacterized protein n=1 Tax=Dorcoceras hygrometricum TaxID=472368 RepID=A0A2Z7C4I4_9LAMI|nr:hypothetical protein F511_37374 [Dorcoceras hygrometricum]
MDRFDDSANKLGSCERSSGRFELVFTCVTKQSQRLREVSRQRHSDAQVSGCSHCISSAEITIISRAVRWSGGWFVMCMDVGRGRRRSGGRAMSIAVVTPEPNEATRIGVPRGKDLSVLMASRDSDRISPENFSDEGGSEIRLSGPNSLDPPTTDIHYERLEMENLHELPPNALLIEIVRSLDVSFSQLTLNAIIAFTCFHRRVSQTRIPVTLDLFHALSSARCTGLGSYIYFQPRLDRKKIDLDEVRALQNGAGRLLVRAPWVRPPRKRVVPDSRDAPRRMGSPRSTDRRSSPQPRQRHVTVDKSTNDRRKDLGPTSGGVPRQSGDDDAQKNLKRGREVENGAPHNVSGGDHLFVEGVNRRDRAGSFWDLSDPDLGWNMGKTLIGDHDVLHLLPQPTESLTHALS